METVLILFLLFSMRDPAMRENLNSLLAFYRENRELIAAIAKNAISMPEEHSANPPKKEESRPREEAGNNRILEEYLSRLK